MEPFKRIESMLTHQGGFWVGAALILLIDFRPRTWWGQIWVLIVILLVLIGVCFVEFFSLFAASSLDNLCAMPGAELPELTSGSQRTLPKTLILQATKTQRARPGSPTRLTNSKSPAPTDFTRSEIFSDTSNEIACEQCGLEQMPK